MAGWMDRWMAGWMGGARPLPFSPPTQWCHSPAAPPLPPCSLLEVRDVNIWLLSPNFYSALLCCGLPAPGAAAAPGAALRDAGEWQVAEPPWVRSVWGSPAVRRRGGRRTDGRRRSFMSQDCPRSEDCSRGPSERTAPWRAACGSCWASCTRSSPSPSSDYTPPWWVHGATF